MSPTTGSETVTLDPNHGKIPASQSIWVSRSTRVSLSKAKRQNIQWWDLFRQTELWNTPDKRLNVTSPFLKARMDGFLIFLYICDIFSVYLYISAGVQNSTGNKLSTPFVLNRLEQDSQCIVQRSFCLRSFIDFEASKHLGV